MLYPIELWVPRRLANVLRLQIQVNSILGCSDEILRRKSMILLT